MSDVDPDAVAAAAAGCPAVDSLSAGHLEEVATYLPGRRVGGIRVTDERVELHVVARWGVTVSDLDAQVRAAVQPLAGGRLLDVHVADFAGVPEPAHAITAAPRPAAGPGPAPSAAAGSPPAA